MRIRRKTNKSHLRLVVDNTKTEEIERPSASKKSKIASPAGRLAAMQTTQEVPIDKLDPSTFTFERVKQAANRLNLCADILLDGYGSVKKQDINAEKFRRAFEFLADAAVKPHQDVEMLVMNYIRPRSIVGEKGRLPVSATEEITVLEDSLETLATAFMYILPTAETGDPDPAGVEEFRNNICRTRAWGNFESQILEGTEAAYVVVCAIGSREGMDNDETLRAMGDHLLEDGLGMRIESAMANEHTEEAFNQVLGSERKKAWSKLLGIDYRW